MINSKFRKESRGSKKISEKMAQPKVIDATAVCYRSDLIVHKFDLSQ